MPVEVQRESKEYLKATVTADITPAGTPEFAFTKGTARPVTWVNGAWAAAAVQLADGRYQRTARTPLIGDVAGIVLAAGDWFAWIRITDAPEVPVTRFDQLSIA